MLIDGGYLYVYKQPLAGNYHSWECRFRRKKICKCLITVLDDVIIDKVNGHTCAAPNAAQVEVVKLRASRKRKGQTTQDTPQQIITAALGNVSNEAAVKLPPMGHNRRAIGSQREDNVAPNILQDRRDIPVIPKE